MGVVTSHFLRESDFEDHVFVVLMIGEQIIAQAAEYPTALRAAADVIVAAASGQRVDTDAALIRLL